MIVVIVVIALGVALGIVLAPVLLPILGVIAGVAAIIMGIKLVTRFVAAVVRTAAAVPSKVLATIREGRDPHRTDWIDIAGWCGVWFLFGVAPLYSLVVILFR